MGLKIWFAVVKVFDGRMVIHFGIQEIIYKSSQIREPCTNYVYIHFKIKH